MPLQFFWCFSTSFQGTQCAQTFRISNYCNALTIVTWLALYEKHAATSRHMSVIVRWRLSLRRACTHHTVSSNTVLSHPLHSSYMFVLLSWNMTAIIECFWGSFSLHSLLYRKCINEVGFLLRNYFLFGSKNDKYFTTRFAVECRILKYYNKKISRYKTGNKNVFHVPL